MPSKKRLLRERRIAYETQLRREVKSERTLDSYRWVLDRSFNALEERGLEINPATIAEKEIDFLSREFYSGREEYKRWQLSIFDGFLKYNGNGIVAELRIGWPRSMRVNVNWLEPWEAMLVKQEAKGVEKVIVHLELDLCMRRVEVVRLTPKSFHGSVVDIHGKGRNGGKWRTVNTHRDTKEIVGWMMMERRRLIQRARVRTPSVPIPEEMIIWQIGERLSGYAEKGTGIDKILRGLKDRCETLYDRPFDFTNHTFRRTGGRMLWKAGVPLETIKDILGHESIDQTVKYLGLNIDDQKEAMDLYAQYQDSIICPENGIFEEGPGVGSGPKEI